MRFPLAVLLLSLPAFAFAAGGDDEPTPTETTTTCSDGKVYDDKTKACTDPQQSQLDDDTLYRAAREFAYAGQLDNAQRALAAMSDQTADRVLTYWGFTHRKKGDVALGFTFYDKALAANPDNLLARSYLGQALVEQGKVSAAWDQLAEIERRGGAESWPGQQLRLAILTGRSDSY